MAVREKQSNEKRLIDANALISYIDECSQESRFRVYYGYAKSFIDDAPTIDAVEVVRCRDCVHNGLPTCFTCYIEQHELIFLNQDPDFFCGAGERKDGDE